MQIKDKEQERKEYEQSPQGKRKKILGNLVIFLIAAALLIALYVSDHHPAFIGTPHPTSIDGFAIIPGETTGAQLYEAGFQLADRSMFSVEIHGDTADSGYRDFFPLDSELEKRSYVGGLSLIRDGKVYAFVDMVNETGSTKTLAETKVQGVTVYEDTLKAEVAQMEGISTGDMTLESLTAILGEPTSESSEYDADGDRPEYIWSKGHYRAELVVHPDGHFHSFSSYYEKD